jgi:acetolactate synthase-1/2/3 large subunit
MRGTIMKLTGAQIIMRLLERQGIEQVPGIPGGANLPLYDAMRDSRVRHILARHEQGGGFIAQGMARATGTTAVCFGTSGPGATNLLTAIADAKLDSVPVVFITGQVPRAMIGTDAFQEIDTYGLTVPITKHNYLVRSAAELLEVIPDAFRIAASGRPGPVVVDVPKDVQMEEAEFDAFPEPGRRDPSPQFADADIARAAQMIAEARRPVMLAGAGVVGADAAPAARRLAEKAAMPAAATLLGLGAFPDGHPLYLGMLGMHGARGTNMLLEECDLVVAVGMRFDDRATGRAAEFCPNASILHIDIDASELGKIKRPALAIRADVGAALAAIEPRVPADARPKWTARMRELRDAHPLAMPGADDPLTPYGIIRQTAALLDDDAIVATDVGQHQMWTAQAFPFRYPRQWLTSGGLGTMGFGLPAAIGAALACPGRMALCFSGDGSIMMNIQELATAAEENANVKVVLLDNAHLGLVRQQQELFYGGRYHASSFAARADFPAIARGFGVAAYDLGATADPLETLARGLSEPGPCLIRVPIAPEENVYPMVPPGAANKTMIGGETHASNRA